MSGNSLPGEGESEGKSHTRALLQALLGPCEASRLASFRFMAALSLLLYTLSWALDAQEWLTGAGYHMSAAASRGLQLPVPLPSPELLAVGLAVYIGAMVAIILDWRPRMASVIVFVGLLYVTTADRLAAFSMNKLALVAWLILLLAPWPDNTQPEPTASPHAAPGPEPLLRSAWPVRVLQATLLLQYFGAGICKLRGGWLDDPQILWLQVQSLYMTDFAAWTVRVLPEWAWAGLHYSALGFELLAPLLFGIRRLRPLAFVWGLGMHLAIGLMMYRVGLFSLSVVAYYTLFLDPKALASLRERVFGTRAILP